MDATGFTPLNGFSFHVNPGAGRTGTLRRKGEHGGLQSTRSARTSAAT